MQIRALVGELCFAGASLLSRVGNVLHRIDATLAQPSVAGASALVFRETLPPFVQALGIDGPAAQIAKIKSRSGRTVVLDRPLMFGHSAGEKVKVLL